MILIIGLLELVYYFLVYLYAIASRVFELYKDLIFISRANNRSNTYSVIGKSLLIVLVYNFIRSFSNRSKLRGIIRRKEYFELYKIVIYLGIVL